MDEREAVSNLFAGAIGVFKNESPHHHYDHPALAAEAVLFADLLLRLVQRAGGVRSADDA